MNITKIKEKYKNSQIFELKQNYVNKIYNKLNKKIEFSCAHSCKNEFTYKEILEVIRKENIKVYITGGTIRNLLQNEEIDNDIDIYVDTTYTKLTNIFYKKFASKKLKWFHSDNFKPYFLIGNKTCSNEFLEILCLDVFEKKTDSPCNSLFVSYNDFIIYDLSGYGIIDTVKKIWRRPPDVKFEEWYKGREILWRMIKFKLKNYKIDLTLKEKREIYKYWTDNMNNLPKEWLIPWRNNLNKSDIKKILKILDKDSKEVGIDFINMLTIFIENNIFSGFHKCSESKSNNNSIINIVDNNKTNIHISKK